MSFIPLIFRYLRAPAGFCADLPEIYTPNLKIIKFLFGDYRQVFLLDPGQSVQSVDVKEIKEGGSTDGQDE